MTGRLLRRSGWVGLALALGVAAPASAQSLSDLVSQTASPDSARVPRAPGKIMASEVVAGSLLAAAAGFGVGLLAEATFCDDCDAGSPGGDTPGIAFGVPVGAVLGVTLVGRWAPPGGRLMDTCLGALVGAAIFAGYVELLEDQGDALRWAGVLFPAGMTVMGYNKSRETMLAEPQAAMLTRPGKHADLTLLRVRFD